MTAKQAKQRKRWKTMRSHDLTTKRESYLKRSFCIKTNYESRLQCLLLSFLLITNGLHLSMFESRQTNPNSPSSSMSQKNFITLKAECCFIRFIAILRILKILRKKSFNEMMKSHVNKLSRLISRNFLMSTSQLIPFLSSTTFPSSRSSPSAGD